MWRVVFPVLAGSLALSACQEAMPQSGGPSQSGQKPARDPGEVDDALLEHLQSGEFEKAYGLMTRGFQSAVTLADFTTMATRNPYLQTSTRIGCFRTVTYEGSVHVRECILESDAGNAHAELYYAIEDGDWRMTGISIGGTPAFAPSTSMEPVEAIQEP